MSEEFKTPDLPRTYYVGRGELNAWLGEWGFSEGAVRTWLENGTIPTHRITSHKRRVKYVPAEVVNVLQLGQTGGAA